METKALREYVGWFCALRSSDLAGGLALVAALRESVYCIEELQHELTAQEKRIAALEAASQPAPVAPIAEGEAKLIINRYTPPTVHILAERSLQNALCAHFGTDGDGTPLHTDGKAIRVVIYPAE